MKEAAILKIKQDDAVFLLLFSQWADAVFYQYFGFPFRFHQSCGESLWIDLPALSYAAGDFQRWFSIDLSLSTQRTKRNNHLFHTEASVLSLGNVEKKKGFLGTSDSIDDKRVAAWNDIKTNHF